MIGGFGLQTTWMYLTAIYICEHMNAATLLECASAYGAQEYQLVGHYFHRALLLRLLAVFPSYGLVLLAYPLFMLVGVDQDVAKNAYTFGLYILPYLLAFAIFSTTKYFIIAHQHLTPVIITQAIVTASHVGFCQYFIINLELGLIGVAISMTLSHLIGAILLLSYLCFNPSYKQTFFFFEKESFHGMWTQFKNEFLIAAPIYLEWLAVELYMLMGAISFSNDEFVALVIFYNMVFVSYTICYGLGITISTEVAVAFGKKDATETKTYIRVSICLSLLLSAIQLVAIYLFKDQFIAIYVQEAEIRDILEVVIQIYLVIIPGDYLQVNLIALLKTIGKEKEASVMFAISYYLVGISVEYTLAVLLELECKGIVIGIGIGIYLQCFLAAWTLSTTDIAVQVDEVHTNRIDSWVFDEKMIQEEIN